MATQLDHSAPAARFHVQPIPASAEEHVCYATRCRLTATLLVHREVPQAHDGERFGFEVDGFACSVEHVATILRDDLSGCFAAVHDSVAEARQHVQAEGAAH